MHFYEGYLTKLKGLYQLQIFHVSFMTPSCNLIPMDDSQVNEYFFKHVCVNKTKSINKSYEH